MLRLKLWVHYLSRLYLAFVEMLISLPISGHADPASHLYKYMSSVAGETAQMCKPITFGKTVPATDPLLHCFLLCSKL